MTKVVIPDEFMPPVERPQHTTGIEALDVGTDASAPIAVVLQAGEHLYAYAHLCESLAHAEAAYASVYHPLGCDCGRSLAIQTYVDETFPIIPCGNTLRLIALEALPTPVSVQCPHCGESFEVEV
jgi:hypothetical protein